MHDCHCARKQKINSSGIYVEGGKNAHIYKVKHFTKIVLTHGQAHERW